MSYLLVSVRHLRLTITIPTLILIIAAIAFALLFPATFVNELEEVQKWILNYFDWLFDWTVLMMLIACIIVYVSPVGSTTIGGQNAKPLLTKPRWYAIVLCTTVATGILFWGCAEPLYHMHEPPYTDIGMSESKVFAMSTLFMHWTWSPYAIYTLISLFFALLYYNSGLPYRVSSLLGKNLIKGDEGYKSIIKDLTDIVCLLALVCGMAASLGAGILTIGGGLGKVSNFVEGPTLWALIAGLIAMAFIMSSVSGLKRGITWLSSFNTFLFFIFIVLFGGLLLSMEVASLAVEGATDYVKNFVPRSIGVDGGDSSWRHSWTTFYWANWMAWAPITALFLGRIGLGYTVREFIKVNLVYTSLFAMIWMVLFGGVAIVKDLHQDGALYQLLTVEGPQSVIFQLIDEAGHSIIGGILLLVIVFISYVTAADSNTTAMSALCTKGISPTSPEAPVFLKMTCGLTIALIAWVMITYAGLDGIRILSVLGGFPVLFLCLWIIVSMLLISLNKKTD